MLTLITAALPIFNGQHLRLKDLPTVSYWPTYHHLVGQVQHDLFLATDEEGDVVLVKAPDDAHPASNHDAFQENTRNLPHIHFRD